VDHAKEKHQEKYVDYKYKPKRGKNKCIKNDVRSSNKPQSQSVHTDEIIEPLLAPHIHSALAIFIIGKSFCPV